MSKRSNKGRKSREKLHEVREVIVSCPGCAAFETLWFRDRMMIPTMKFTQRRSGIYHDCGTKKPCRLFRVWGKRD